MSCCILHGNITNTSAVTANTLLRIALRPASHCVSPCLVCCNPDVLRSHTVIVGNALDVFPTLQQRGPCLSTNDMLHIAPSAACRSVAPLTTIHTHCRSTAPCSTSRAHLLRAERVLLPPMPRPTAHSTRRLPLHPLP